MSTVSLTAVTPAYPFITDRIKGSVYAASDIARTTPIQSQIDSTVNHPTKIWRFTGLEENDYIFSIDIIDEDGILLDNITILDVTPSDLDNSIGASRADITRLENMISADFAGTVDTLTYNPGAQTENVWFRANAGVGVYTNFLSAASTPISVSDDDGLVDFLYDKVSGFYKKSSVPIPPARVDTEAISALANYGAGKSYTFTSGTSGHLLRVGAVIPIGFRKDIKVRFTSNFNVASTLYWQSSIDLITAIVVTWISDGVNSYYFEASVTASDNTEISNLFLLITNSTNFTSNVTVTLSSLTYTETLANIRDRAVLLSQTVSNTNSAVSTIQTKQATVDSVLKVPDFDLSQFSDNQSVSISGGFTGARRITWEIPTNKLFVGDVIKIQFKSVNGANTGNVLVYKHNSVFVNPVTWTLASDTFYYSNLIQITVTQVDIDIYNSFEIIMQAYNSSGLSADTISINAQFISKGSYINSNTTDASLQLVSKTLKEANFSITGFLDNQTLVIAHTSTVVRMEWQVPISKILSGDVIKVQFKSINGANAGNCNLYKYSSTFIGTIVWSLNHRDGFYYSQVFQITVSQSDIDTYTNFVLIMQAYNASGLEVDTVSINTQIVIKNNFIDINALKASFENSITPPNLINTLEILWRGYASMIPKTVKKDGTGDFTTIQAAYNSITDAAVNKQYDIRFYDDFTITDLTELFLQSNTNTHNSQTTDITNSIVLFKTKNWVHVRSMNGERTLKIISPTTLTAASYQNIQVVYPEGNCIIRGFKSVIQGGRYSFHQEANGLTSSPDYHATTIIMDVHEVHLGNFESLGYPAGAWTSTMAEADGTTSGFKKFMINVKVTSANPTPFYFHSNANFDEPTEHHFINYKIVYAKNINSNDCDVRYADIGSGKRSLINIVGSSFQKLHVDNNIRCSETTMTSADLYMNGGANITGHSNIPMLCFNENPFTLCFKAVANGADIDVTGGTAYNAIFGGELKRYLGSSDKGGAIWGTKRIQNPWGAPNSQIFSLPYRLGNCSSVNKTLNFRVKVGGVTTDYTFTFNQNYMTADGSSYSYNTTPAINEGTILSAINAFQPSVFQVSIGDLMKMFSFADCMETGVNVSSSTILTGKGVVRDVANGWNAWRLTQAGEKAEAICGQRLNPGVGENYDTSEMILIKKALFSASVLNISTTPGLYYKCGSNGSFVSTVTQSEACLYAIDAFCLMGI